MRSAYNYRNGSMASRRKESFPHGALYGIIIGFLFSILSFYAGFCLGWHMSSPSLPSSDVTPPNKEQTEKERQLEQSIRNLKSELAKERKAKPERNDPNKSNDQQKPHFQSAFSKPTSDFAVGMEFVDRTAFAEAFDTGVPLDRSEKTNDQVMIVYGGKGALPRQRATHDGDLLTPQQATQNCENVHVVLTQPKRSTQCIAIMGQYESFHVQKFMRIDPTGKSELGKGVHPSLPFAYVPRGIQQNGRISVKVPKLEQTTTHWEQLVPYLNSLDDALETLKPLLKQVASHNRHNTVTVLVCNFGQSELLLNFICNARAKGFGNLLENVFVFATDPETQDLCEFIGIQSIYLESIFGDMPSQAAKAYADRTFRAMMAAKVYCVHLVALLGYDILFQDVDVVWFKNPLEWFHDTNSPHYNFDVYFQDDGNHGLFYAPYSANTGFYYVRNNPRTQYFFTSLLMGGDLILSTSSHQIALISILNEHASAHGLKVKIWERNKPEFPGGYTYHRKQSASFMKDLVQGKAKDTYIFHMSWTKNKSNKFKFFQQLGEWYLDESCIGVSRKEIDGGGSSPKNCCSAEPIVKCHYRDKPSKDNCSASPSIDKGKASFW